MKPLQNTIDRQAITDRTRTIHESESPVAGADVLFTPEGHNRAPLRRVTLAEGAATIQAGSKTEQVGELLVRMNNRTLLKQRVAIARSSDRQVPSLEWPDPVIVQFELIFAAHDGPDRSLCPRSRSPRRSTNLCQSSNDTDQLTNLHSSVTVWLPK